MTRMWDRYQRWEDKRRLRGRYRVISALVSIPLVFLCWSVVLLYQGAVPPTAIVVAVIGVILLGDVVALRAQRKADART